MTAELNEMVQYTSFIKSVNLRLDSVLVQLKLQHFFVRKIKYFFKFQFFVSVLKR